MRLENKRASQNKLANKSNKRNSDGFYVRLENDQLNIIQLLYVRVYVCVYWNSCNL